MHGDRDRSRRVGAVLEAVEGVVLLVPTVLAAPVLRFAYNRWGTTKGEGAAEMPGDALIVSPKLTHTRSITIDAPADEVWSWLAQIGQGRGGLYSYDGLENVIGCDIHSADHVVDAYQHLAPGDLVRLGPAGYPAFRVVRVDPPRALVLISADPESGRGAQHTCRRRVDHGDHVGVADPLPG